MAACASRLPPGEFIWGSDTLAYPEPYVQSRGRGWRFGRGATAEVCLPFALTLVLTCAAGGAVAYSTKAFFPRSEGGG
jgi:hypothetical protein